MPIGNNPNLVGLTGAVLQKSAFAAYTKQITKMSSSAGKSRAGEHGHGIAMTGDGGQDTTIISREGIAALESARSISEETVVRHDNSVDESSLYPQATLLLSVDIT